MSYWIEQIGSSWATTLKDEIRKPYLKELAAKLKHDRKYMPVSPTKDRTFRAYKLTPFEEVKVCIVGYVPYTDPSIADGLVFGLNDNKWNVFPSELDVINQAIEMDYMRETSAFVSCFWHDMEYLATQGVLMLPRLLTTVSRDIDRYREWASFTNTTIAKLCKRGEVVFLLWGENTWNLYDYIKSYSNAVHKVGVLKSKHPRSFEDFPHSDRIFTRTNKYLTKLGKTPIEWAI